MVANPNLIVFDIEPKFTNEDYHEAHKWNAFNKEVRCYRGMYIVKAHKPEKEDDITLTKAECELYFERLLKPTTLDAYLHNVHSLHIIKIQIDNWKLSSCSCVYWLKNYKCSHVIAIVVRLKLASFESISIDLPMEKERKPGAKRKTKLALVPQSVEPLVIVPRGIEVSSSSSSSEEDLPQPKKRGRKPKQGPTKKLKL
jgi:hypothetical protein